MPSKSFTTPAGPCPTPTSRQDPSPCLLPSESGYSLIDVSETRPPPLPAPSLPDIILHSSRFASIQNRIKKALKVPAKSGFTRTVPEVVQERGGNQDRAVSADSALSMRAIYEGLPVSPSESCFSNSNVSHAHAQMSPAPAPLAGLGLLLPVPGTNELRCLSSFVQRSISPVRLLEARRASQLEVPPLVARDVVEFHAQQPLDQGTSLRYTRYAGLGHGLPSHMRRQRTASSNRVASSIRTITQVLSGSYAYAYAHGTLRPPLTRCPPRIGMSVTWARHHKKCRGNAAAYGGLDETIVRLKRTWAAISRRVGGGREVRVKTRKGDEEGAEVRSRFVEVEIM